MKALRNLMLALQGTKVPLKSFRPRSFELSCPSCNVAVQGPGALDVGRGIETSGIVA